MTENKTFAVDNLLGLPRLSGLALSPDGSRLVVCAALPGSGGKKYVGALHELDPAGGAAPRRLTRSASGESGAAFAPDGSLLFVSARPDPEGDDDKDREDKPAVWLLPAGGGEAQVLSRPPGGVEALAVSRKDGAFVFAAASHPDTAGWEQDAAREKAREKAGVGAQLFTGYPIRQWDHYLGPRERHLYLAPQPEAGHPAGEVKDLIPAPGRSLDGAAFDLTPDARTIVTSRWKEAEDPRERAQELVAIDAASGKERLLAGGDDAWYGSPACSPDGRLVAAVRRGIPTPEAVADTTLWLVDLQSGEGRDLLENFDLWPQNPVWDNGSGAVFFTADEDGRTPVFRVDVGTGAVARLSREGSFDSLCPSPDGRTVYALRSTVTEPPHPVALDAVAGDAEPRRVRAFAEIDDLSLPARVERVSARGADGASVRSWLLLPPGASVENPAPLAVSIHGGPVNSWSGWHWRWNPNVLVDDGWAVLLPDPALSTGYGLDHIRRGWGRWGDVVYNDLLGAVDDAAGREEIDAAKTVAMGGSFGGYMVNWIAGHTTRFDALVTHASLWSLETFHGQTDLGVWWEREFGDPYADPSRYRQNSPHLHVGEIETPMLVVHGELDYRVPIGEALALWTDLKRHNVPAKFLYFPDENHWVLKPNNARVWYETVVSFINHHARGRTWTQPDLL